MAHKDEYEYRTAATWFIVGGAVGACAALFLAPTSGEKTRARLAQGLRETKASLLDLTGDLTQKAERVRDEAARVAENVFSTGYEVLDSTEKAHL